MRGLLKNLFSRVNTSKFSKRFVMTYSLFVAVPLIIFLIVLNIIVDFQYTKTLVNVTEDHVVDNSIKIKDVLNNVNLVEKMVNANGELLLFLLSEDDRGEDDVIQTIVSHSVTLERIQSVQQKIASLKIFCANPNIPERFPTILQASRGNFENKKYWAFNDTEEFVDSVIRLNENCVTTTRKIYYSKKLVGYLQISIASREFFSFLYDTDSPYDNDFVFYVDENAGILEPVVNPAIEIQNLSMAEKTAAWFSKFYFKKDAPLNSEVITKKTFGAIYSYTAVPELGIVICHRSDIRLILKNYVFLIIITFVGLLFIFFLFFISIKFSTDRLLFGVYALMDGMNEIKRGNYGEQITVISQDELAQTQETFNLMSKTIKNQVEQIKTEQRLISDTEMKAMLNQINAHFLYNVLETIRMQALLNDDEDTAENILLLGKMMRYCLRWRESTVSLEKEIEYITSYVQILNVRNDYKIDLKIEIPQALYIVEIPKMIIQPFIENAFFYAIEPMAKDSEIRIYTIEDIEHKRLWINVQDFGPGMSQSKVQEIYEYLKDDTPEKSNTGSIGLKNIQQRLTALYGSEYRLLIDSTEGGGTTVKVPVPFGGNYDDNSDS